MTALGDRLAEIGPRRFPSSSAGMKALIWEGRVFLPRLIDPASPLSPGIILYGTRSMSRLTQRILETASISRLIAKNVFSGLVTAWRFAAWPTRRSPDSVNATIEGVVPRALGVFDDLGGRTLHHGDAGIGRAEIDTNDFAHGPSYQSRTERPRKAPFRSPGKCRQPPMRWGAATQVIYVWEAGRLQPAAAFWFRIAGSLSVIVSAAIAPIFQRFTRSG